MLTLLLNEDCVRYILNKCDQLTIEVLRHVPDMIPSSMLLRYRNEEDRVCTHAARRGYLELLVWARGCGYKWNEWTFVAAARGGHLGVLKWLTENGCSWNSIAYSEAAEEGHLEVLEWLREQQS